MSYIGVQPTAGQYRKLDNISSGFNGSTTSFTTSVSGTNVTAGTAQQLLVSLGGVIQQPDTDYTVSTNTITFTTAPTSGLTFFAVLMGDALNTVTTSDGAITTAKLAGSLSVGLAAGTASAPSLYFTGDTNTGIYSLGADQVAISTGGTGRLFVDSSGRVGIGSSSPSDTLDIGTGGIFFSNQSSGSPYPEQKLKWSNDSTTANGFYISQGTDRNGKIWHEQGLDIQFGTSNQQRMVLDSSGRLGIGTTSVTGKLSIDGSALNPISSLNTASNYAIALYGGSTTGNGNGIAFCNDNGTAVGGAIVHIDQGSNNLGDLAFYTAATASSPSEKARLTASGQWLVGTSTARTVDGFAAAIQAEGASAATGAIGAYRTSNDQYGAYLTFGKSRSTSLGGSAVVSSGDEIGILTFCGADGTDTNSIAARIGAYVDGTPGADDMPGRLVFSTTADGASTPTERMRIKAVGTTNIFGPTDTFWVATSATGTGDAIFIGSNGASGINGGSVKIKIYSDGDIENVNNSYGALSDSKLKENIIDATSQWEDIKALQVRKYNLKPDTGHSTHTQIGLIAQEAELISPGLVSEYPDRDEDGNDLGTVTKSVNYSVLYMKAVKALQEAMERIETLEAKVAALESA